MGKHTISEEQSVIGPHMGVDGMGWGKVCMGYVRVVGGEGGGGDLFDQSHLNSLLSKGLRNTSISKHVETT